MPGVLQSRGSERVRHNLVTEQPPTHPRAVTYLLSFLFECYVPGTFTVGKYRDKHGTREGNGKVMRTQRSLLYSLGRTWRCWLVLVAPYFPTLCDPMECSIPGLPVHHQLPELTQTHVHRVGDGLSHPLLSPSPPAYNLSQNQGLFQ